ncbi:MAG: hypothetical protein P8Y14_19920 [Anaerolineales bacterium]|jgi:hypothetical protein
MTDNFDKKLTKILYRRACPDGIALGEYETGLLPEAQVRQIRQHVSECPRCQRELEQLRDFLRDVEQDLEPGLTRRIKTWIAERIPDFSQGGEALTPAFSVRGEAEQSLFYKAGEAELSLEIQEDPRHAGRMAMHGLLTGIGPETLKVLLLDEDEQVATVGVDELGNFAMEDLETGEYTLVLSGPEVEILVPGLVV